MPAGEGLVIFETDRVKLLAVREEAVVNSCDTYSADEVKEQGGEFDPRPL